MACCLQGDIKGTEGREGMKQLPPASFQGRCSWPPTVLILSKASILISLVDLELGEVAKLVP